MLLTAGLSSFTDSPEYCCQYGHQDHFITCLGVVGVVRAGLKEVRRKTKAKRESREMAEVVAAAVVVVSLGGGHRNFSSVRNFAAENIACVYP